MASPRILLVDDESALLSLLTRHLERRGYSVSAFLTAEFALEGLAANEWTPDLLIADHILPGQSGSTLAGLLLDRFPRLFCLLSSGHPLSLQEVSESHRGRTAILQKPYSPDRMEAAIRDILGRGLPPEGAAAL